MFVVRISCHQRKDGSPDRPGATNSPFKEEPSEIAVLACQPLVAHLRKELKPTYDASLVARMIAKTKKEEKEEEKDE